MSTQAQLAELQPSFSRRLERLLRACPHPVGITSGFRSRADQQRLWDLYRSGVGAPANRPGTSKHETGQAADLAYPAGAREPARRWCHSNARRFGLRFPYRHEPWHIESDGIPDPIDDEDDDDMSPETLEQLRGIVRDEVNRVAALLIRGDHPDPSTGDTHPDNLSRIRSELRALSEKVDRLT